LNKIKDNFSSFEQQIFVSSFYCYLNYDKNIDFVVDLDDIWKWLGFSTKQKTLMLFEKKFILNTDYINSLNLEAKQELEIKKHGGIVFNNDYYYTTSI
jgi:hypothetical protein